MRKAIFTFVLAGTLSIVAMVGAIFLHGFHVSRQEVISLTTTALPASHPTHLVVEGKLLSSAQAVTKVSQNREGQNISLTVRQTIVLPGRRNGAFREDVALTDDIKFVSFGEPGAVIWKR